MSDKTHPWIYVIIPVDTGHKLSDAYRWIPPTIALFSAFCKDCRTYFTESIPYETNGAVLTPSSLPRTGCDAREDADEGITSLPGIEKRK